MKKRGNTVKRTQTGGSRLLLTLLILIFSIGLSACAGRNSPEVILTTPDITEPPSESVPAETQLPASTQTPAETQTPADLTVEDVPALVPDVLKLREKKYEDMPFLETQEQLSEYALWNLLWGRTEFECRLSWDLSYGE